MSKKYNSKKNIVLGNVLKTDFANYVKHKRTYNNTQSDWVDKEELKSKDEKNYDLLKFAFEGNKKMMKIALTTGVGADINTVDSNGNNALMLAVYSGDVDAVKFLLNFHKDEKSNILSDVTPIDLTHFNKDLLSPLHLAVHLNNIHIVKALLDAGLDANILGKYKETPLMYATRANNAEMIDILLHHNKENAANINQRNREGLTPLMLAAQNKDRVESFYTLLKSGAEIMMKDYEGRNAFMHAANNNCSHYMDTLIKRADNNMLNMVNTQDKNGVSTMMIVAKRGNRQALRVLISRGANVFLKDNHDKTALDYAIKAENPTCKEILVKTYKIYENAKEIQDELQREKFLQNNLGEFGKQNRVQNSCIK